jgi:hypothetical protein
LCSLVRKPYIMKDYFSTPKPPVKLAKVAIGNGAMANTPEFEDASMVSVELCKRVDFAHVSVEDVCYRNVSSAHWLRP